jgi:hypothetical protein
VIRLPIAGSSPTMIQALALTAGSSLSCCG